MKIVYIAVLLSAVFLSAAYSEGRPPEAEKVTGAGNAEECFWLEPVPADSISRNVYDALRQDWDAWNQKSEKEKMVCSQIPGFCAQNFSDWEECEDFLGFSIPNPLEECPWLEKRSYANIPDNVQKAPYMRATWTGTEDGYVKHISINASYQHEELGVMLSVDLYGEGEKVIVPEDVCPVKLGKQDNLENENSLPQIVSEASEWSVSSNAYWAKGMCLYHLYVVGKPDAQKQTEDMLETVLNYFLENIR